MWNVGFTLQEPITVQIQCTGQAGHGTGQFQG